MTNTGPGRRSGQHDQGSERAVARSASYALAKGAGIVAIAIVIGIVLLQIVDDGSSGPASTGDTQVPESTTTTIADDTSSTTATTSGSTGGAERLPEEVRVMVLNAGAPSGSAGLLAENLKSVGYVNQPLPPDNDEERRDGDAVMCREGFDAEAVTLSVAVGTGSQVIPFRDPPPAAVTDEIDCVALVGAPV